MSAIKMINSCFKKQLKLYLSGNPEH